VLDYGGTLVTRSHVVGEATGRQAHLGFQLDGYAENLPQDVAQALAHPQVRARGMVIETAFPDGTPLLAAGNPVKLSGHADPQVRAFFGRDGVSA
jgi:hypothetical protein